MDIKQYHHAIIGCGRISPIHKNAFVESGVSHFSYCDLDIHKAELLSENGNNIFSDYRKIPIKGLDSVSVCTDHGSHLQISNYFLSNGVSVVVEKPCCLPMQNPEAFLLKYVKEGAIFTQIVQHRYDSIVKFVKNLIDEGKLGHIVLADFTLYCHRSKNYFLESPWKGRYASEGGSSIVNQAFHLVDLINYFFGFTPKVECYRTNYWLKDIIETDETSFALFHYPEFHVSLKTTICSSETWFTRLDIIGSKAAVSFSIDEPFVFYYFSDTLKTEIQTYFSTIRDSVLPSSFGYFGNSHKKQIKSFIESTIAGRNINLPDITSILNTHKLIKLLYL